MKNFVNILKEVGISISIIIVVSAADVYFFKDKIPSNVDVPKAQEYTNLERENYKVVGDIQDVVSPTETYTAGSSELELYQTELRYVAGSTNPFVSDIGESNLPSETVSSPVNNSSYNYNDNFYEQDNFGNAEYNLNKDANEW